MTGFIVAGLVTGALAWLFWPGKPQLGLVTTLLVGIAGAIAGGLSADVVGTAEVFELKVLGFIVALGTAVILIGVARYLAQGGGRQGPG